MSHDHRLPRPQALLDSIETQTPIGLSTSLWRVVTDGRDPLRAGRSGGRWDDGSFDVLYTSSERNGALAGVKPESHLVYRCPRFCLQRRRTQHAHPFEQRALSRGKAGGA